MKTIPFIMAAVFIITLSLQAEHKFVIIVAGVSALCLAAVVCGVMSASSPFNWGIEKKPASPRMRRATWLITLGALLLSLTVFPLDWPLRLSYATARPALNALARQVQSGAEVSHHRAGLFTVYQSDIDHGLVCLWITDDMGEPRGFIQGAPHQVQSHFPDHYDVLVLDDHWCLVSSL